MRPAELVRGATVLWRTFGTRGVMHRVRFVVGSAAGRYLAMPRPVPDGVRAAAVPGAWPFRVDAAAVAAATNTSLARARAAQVLAGKHQAYRDAWIPRPVRPDDWNINPLTGYRYDASAPWFRIAHYRPEAGDIKAVWEPSRFAWAYDLMRAWMLDRDERCPETFWRGFEAFIAGCPPYRGVQWACGQETAIRTMAWLWAECAFANARATTPERLASLRTALAWAGERILDGHDWAASQRNNHGLSEAVALVILGARFRHVHPDAQRWSDRGVRLLERYVADQFAEDGWFIQHSFTYARLALDHLVLAERVLRAEGRGVSDAARTRIRAAIALLAELMDVATGQLPLHGANDGAFVLPLTTAEYRDFRPSLTAAAAVFDAPLPHGAAPDREMLAWLGAPAPRHAPPPAIPRIRSGPSGWVHAVTGHVRVFARAAAYRSRPGQIDPLHTDIWIDGRPIATDAGTYRYRAPAPWNNGLAGLEVHNTVGIDGLPAATRGPRFLWLRWPVSALRDARMLPDGTLRIVMENRSWQHEGCLHRRECLVSDDAVAVIDEITATSPRELTATLHWLLDGPSDLVEVTGDDGLVVRELRAAEAGTHGWISETYGARRPGTSVLVTGTLRSGRVLLESRFGAVRRHAALVAARAADPWQASPP